MLMMIGPVQFKVLPFNMHETNHAYGADFAEKPIMGSRPGLEFVGKASETWVVRAALFPGQYGGGNQLTLLQAMTGTGIPQYLMRGDGGLLGWVHVLKVSEKATFISRSGVGRKIEVDISLQRAAAPDIGGFIAAISRLF